MNTDIITTIQQILKNRNEEFDNSKKIKLVRHKDSRPKEDRKIRGAPYEGTLYNLYRTELSRFLDYQNEQRISNFGSVEYIVSFIGFNGAYGYSIIIKSNNLEILSVFQSNSR